MNVEYMDDLELTILTYDDIWGWDRFEKFDYRWACCGVNEENSCFGADPYPTDFTRITKAKYNHSWEDVICTKTPIYSVDGRFLGVKTDQQPDSYHRKSFALTDSGMSIRPVLLSGRLFSKILKPEKSRRINVIRFGEYPQNAPKTEIQLVLEQAYLEGIMKETGCSYTINNPSRKPGQNNDFEPLVLKEYMYNGEKYVRMPISQELQKRVFSALYRDNHGHDYVWVKVEPVAWLVDEDRRRFVAAKPLLGDIMFSNRDSYDGNFNNTWMRKFMNKYMLRDLIQHINFSYELGDIAGKNGYNEVKSIIEEIYGLCSKIGLNDDNAFVKNVDLIIKEYNEKLNQLLFNLENDEVILESYDAIVTTTIFKLNTILEQIKMFSKKYDTYLSLIDSIDKYISIIEGNESDESDDFTDDLKSIVKICLPFLSEENRVRITNNILAIFREQKQEIKNFINASVESNDAKLPYGNLHEMHLYLRHKLQPILLEISSKISKRDDTDGSDYKKTLAENREKYENKLLSSLSSEVDDTYALIKEKIDMLPSETRELYERELADIMDHEIDYSKDFNYVVDVLAKKWSRLEALLSKIERYCEEISRLEGSFVDLSKLKTHL